MPLSFTGLLWVDVVVVAAGVLSSAVTAYVLAWLSVHGAAVHLFGIWVIPAGAILSGYAATSGSYGAARVLGRCPGIRAFLSMVASSALTYVAVYYLSFECAS